MQQIAAVVHRTTHVTIEVLKTLWFVISTLLVLWCVAWGGLAAVGMAHDQYVYGEWLHSSCVK